MKRIYLIPIIGLYCLFFTSCGDMLKDIRPYLDRGETIYVGKLDSIEVFSGKNRIMIEGQLPYGSTQTKCIIEWVDPSGKTDWKEFPIVRTGEVDRKFEFLLADLLEGQHDFTIITMDTKDNSSIKVQVGGYSYGETYRSTLENRRIREVTSQYADTENGTIRQAAISWLNINNDEVRGCNVEYELDTDNGEFGTVYVPVQEQYTYITGYKSEGILRWNTAYMPDSLAIDVFTTEKLEMFLPN